MQTLMQFAALVAGIAFWGFICANVYAELERRYK